MRFHSYRSQKNKREHLFLHGVPHVQERSNGLLLYSYRSFSASDQHWSFSNSKSRFFRKYTTNGKRGERPSLLFAKQYCQHASILLEFISKETAVQEVTVHIQNENSPPNHQFTLFIYMFYWVKHIECYRQRCRRM